MVKKPGNEHHPLEYHTTRVLLVPFERLADGLFQNVWHALLRTGSLCTLIFHRVVVPNVNQFFLHKFAHRCWSIQRLE